MPGRAPILLVTRNFPPMVGGMERLIHHVYLELSASFDTALVGPRGCAEFVNPGSTVASCPLSPLAIFLLCLEAKAVRLARRLRPRLVFAGSGLAAHAAVHAARRAGARSACYLHGLDVVVESSVYRRFFLPAIRRCDLLVVNSRNTAALAARAGVDPAKLHVLHPGVTLPDPASAPGGAFRRMVDGEARKLILSVGRIHRRKGLAEFVQQALPAVVAAHPEVLLVVAGAEAGQALSRSADESGRLLDAARRAGMEGHIRFAGKLSEEMLSSAYAESDLLVFPVLDVPGDVEGFGMVPLEAAAHGLPTVAFAVGGVPEAVAHGKSGYLVPPGDYAAFAQLVVRHLGGGLRLPPGACRAHASAFAWRHFGERLREICAA